jgi:arylsulfatase A-like enzyme
MMKKSMAMVARHFLAAIIGMFWIAALDGVSRLLQAGTVRPSVMDLGVVAGAALFLGALVGIVVCGLFLSARTTGTVHGISGGAIARLARIPAPYLLLSVFLFMLPIGLSIPLRSALLVDYTPISAFFDVIACALGWFLALWTLKRFEKRPGKPLSRGFAGCLLIASALAASVVMPNFRSVLVLSDTWDLALIGEYAVVYLGAALLLPDGSWARRSAAIVLMLAVGGGGFSLWRLHVDDDLRCEVASDWRPGNWIVQWSSRMVDVDADGFSPLFGGGDCNDERDDVNPEAIEIIGNGVDENCRGGDREPVPPWPSRPAFVPLPNSSVEPKSILLITVDALRRDHLGVYGYSRPTSPRIDALAAQGILFSNAYSSAPVTRLSVPILHTGRNLGEIAWDHTVYPDAMLDSVHTVAEILKTERSFETVAFITNRYMGKKWGWTQGFDEIDDEFVLPEETYNKSVPTGEGLSTAVSRWIERHADRRFFVWVHFMDPHDDYNKHEGSPDWGDSDLDRYDSEIWYTDRAIGRLLDKLEEIGIEDETAVVVLSDHGELFGEHGERGHGNSLFEEDIQIPLVVSSPGFGPSIASCLVGHVDVAPTLLNLVGIDGGRYGMSGASLVPDMMAEACTENREIVAELRFGKIRHPELRSLIGGRWKVVADVRLGTYRLYDLASADKERRDVSDLYPGILESMKNRMLAWVDVYANREMVAILNENTAEDFPEGFNRVDARFDNGVELVGFDLGSRRISDRAASKVHLVFRTPDRVRQNCVVKFRLIDDAGQTRFKMSHRPFDGALPVKSWPLERFIIDTLRLKVRDEYLVDGEIDSGEYEVRIGLTCDGESVEVVNGPVDKEGRIVVGAIRVESRRDSCDD